jgi:hypothetical protein
MTTHNTPAGTRPATSTPVDTPPVPAPPSWAWRRGALILAGAAQLIIISALNSADPLAVAGVLVLAVGIAGGILHVGLFFVPALVVLAVGGVKLWREPS